MLLYNFTIDTYKIDVTAEKENDYHVSIDGVYAGAIHANITDDSPYLIWKTKDLIPEDLVQKIGAAIEDEDEQK